MTYTVPFPWFPHPVFPVSTTANTATASEEDAPHPNQHNMHKHNEPEGTAQLQISKIVNIYGGKWVV
jgi:hypothetical protein